MNRISPHDRKRVDTVVVTAQLSRSMTNGELLTAWIRASQGKLAETTIAMYTGYIADIIEYYTPPDGPELHVSLWTKQHVWEYAHHAEANYCRSFAPFILAGVRGVACRQRVWIGHKPTAEATAVCATCPQFESSREAIARRLEAIHRFFKFLARSGVIPLNFMRDVVAEYYEDITPDLRREKRRNPTVEEMRKLVNETPNLRNRAFYACSAKWGFRLNELALDRYASLPGFEDGNDLVIIPEKGRIDKRKGNRVSVVDQELRPILEQYLRWWEHTVRRKHDGTPATTKLWLSEHGNAFQNDPDFYNRIFYPDCYRLGLMQPGDELLPLKRWTAHCQRHFMEKQLMMNNCPDMWSKHLRGDIVKDARGHYFVPTPDQIREKYYEWMPKIGFHAAPQTDPRRLPAFLQRDSNSIHVAILQEGHARVAAWSTTGCPVLSSRIVETTEEGEEIRNLYYVPRRRQASFLHAYQRIHPTLNLGIKPDLEAPAAGRAFKKRVLLKQFEDALLALGARPDSDASVPSEAPSPHTGEGAQPEASVSE